LKILVFDTQQRFNYTFLLSTYSTQLLRYLIQKPVTKVLIKCATTYYLNQILP